MQILLWGWMKKLPSSIFRRMQICCKREKDDQFHRFWVGLRSWWIFWFWIVWICCILTAYGWRFLLVNPKHDIQKNLELQRRTPEQNNDTVVSIFCFNSIDKQTILGAQCSFSIHHSYNFFCYSTHKYSDLWSSMPRQSSKFSDSHK